MTCVCVWVSVCHRSHLPVKCNLILLPPTWKKVKKCDLHAHTIGQSQPRQMLDDVTGCLRKDRPTLHQPIWVCVCSLYEPATGGSQTSGPVLLQCEDKGPHSTKVLGLKLPGGQGLFCVGLHVLPGSVPSHTGFLQRSKDTLSCPWVWMVVGLYVSALPLVIYPRCTPPASHPTAGYKRGKRRSTRNG